VGLLAKELNEEDPIVGEQKNEEKRMVWNEVQTKEKIRASSKTGGSYVQRGDNKGKMATASRGFTGGGGGLRVLKRHGSDQLLSHLPNKESLGWGVRGD